MLPSPQMLRTRHYAADFQRLVLPVYAVKQETPEADAPGVLFD